MTCAKRGSICMQALERIVECNDIEVRGGQYIQFFGGELPDAGSCA